MGMGMTINQMIDDLGDEVKEAAITLQSTLASLDRLEGVHGWRCTSTRRSPP